MRETYLFVGGQKYVVRGRKEIQGWIEKIQIESIKKYRNAIITEMIPPDISFHLEATYGIG